MNFDKEVLNKLFEYRDGDLIWRSSGKLAGTPHDWGYYRTQIGNKLYYNHRLIFCMHHGYVPKIIDHIDGVRTNNRIENLRVATPSQNLQNSKRRIDNKSGTKGVSWDNSRSQWAVRIKVGSIYRYFGRYQDLELAELVATEAREKYHTNFVRHE